MRRRERGYALILVLVLLALGSLLIAPTLRLASTTLSSKQITTDVLMEQYARDGGMEFALWELQYGTVTASLTTDGAEANFSQITLNGVTPLVTIKLVAKPQTGGVTLATDDIIRPTKSVTPNVIANNLGSQTFTYTITLTQTSADTSQGLDVIYDVLPLSFGRCDNAPSNHYVTGSSFLDGVPIADPSCVSEEAILRWPATGNFSSPIRDFQDSQVKVLTFQFHGNLSNNKTHCNWAVLKPWNTLSGQQAPITVGTPPGAGCDAIESVEVSKTSDPEFIPPNVDIVVTYTINMSASGVSSVNIERITDYLPPGFTYCSAPAPAPAPPAGGTTDPDCQMPSGEAPAHPTLFLENVNGVDRWRLRWDCQGMGVCGGSGSSEKVTLNPGGPTKTITFTAKTSQSSSGNFFNEVILLTDMEAKDAFEEIGVNDSDFGGGVFSWNTGTVHVPAYDIRSDGGQAIGQGNALLEAGGVELNSWNVENQ